MKAFRAFGTGMCMLLISSGGIFSCGIQSFEDLADLNPPYALMVRASLQPRQLELSFVTFNYENNFSGFNVYVGMDRTYVNNQSRVIPNVRTENVPTFITNNRAFRAEPKRITLTIDETHRAIEPLKDMGERFHVGISAYDAVYRQNSKCAASVEVDWRLDSPTIGKWIEALPQ